MNFDEWLEIYRYKIRYMDNTEPEDMKEAYNAGIKEGLEQAAVIVESWSMCEAAKAIRDAINH